VNSTAKFADLFKQEYKTAGVTVPTVYIFNQYFDKAVH